MALFGLRPVAGRLRRQVQRSRLRRAGLDIPDDCRITGEVEWGTEPYLISIGRHVTITNRVVFITHDGGTWVVRDREGSRGVIRYGRIDILDNCFIGHSAILLPGITIGPNSVVAAGSVVTRSVPPDTIVGGVPARVIRSIDEYAERLVETAPRYDQAAYRSDKRRELLRLFPRP